MLLWSVSDFAGFMGFYERISVEPPVQPRIFRLCDLDLHK